MSDLVRARPELLTDFSGKALAKLANEATANLTRQAGRRVEGPSENTIKKILAGDAVSERMLRLFCTAFDLSYEEVVIRSVRPEEESLRKQQEALRKVEDPTSFQRWMTVQILDGSAEAFREMNNIKWMSEAEFCDLVISHLTPPVAGARGRALCGKKAYGETFVDNYFLENYRFARELYALEQRKPRCRLQRLFIEHPTAGYEAAEIEVIQGHQSHTKFGVESRCIRKDKIRALEREFPELMQQFFDERFGFLLIDKNGSRRALTHLQPKGAKKMAVCSSTNPYVVHELEGVYARVLSLATEYAAGDMKTQTGA